MKIIKFLPLMCLLILINACSKEEHHAENTVFSTTKPWKQDVQLKLEYVAQIRAIQHIEIRAIEKGYLQSIYVDEGQAVKKGAKMFQIMPNMLQADYEKTKAEYEFARTQYESTRVLFDKKVVSENEMSLKKADLNRRQAVMKQAKTRLDFTNISAPFDGIIDRFRVRLGSLLEEGELLTTLSDISKLWVYFNVSERDYLNYMNTKKNAGKGDTVKLRLANGNYFDQPGVIDTIEADFDSETGNLPFRASFDNPNALLRHGETGNIVLTEDLKDVLVIPQKAVFDVLDKRFVFVISEAGKVMQREVFIQNEVPHLFIIKSGITEQDKVLLEGLGKVTAEMKIKTKLLVPDEVKKGFELAAH